MMVPTDILQQVLDSTAPDSPEARDVQRDLARIRRGMQLAADGPALMVDRVPVWRRPVAVAAGLSVLVTAGVAVSALRRDRTAPVTASTSAAAPATSTESVASPGQVLAAPAPSLTLADRVQQADRIVVGTVTKLTNGVLKTPDGESIGNYVLATIAVSETLKPAASQQEVVAFDYDYSGAIVPGDGSAKPWAVGQTLLLFLVSDAGTVSEHLQPAHLQVAEGAAGRHEVKGGALDAAFTLDEVRRLARR